MFRTPRQGPAPLAPLLGWTRAARADMGCGLQNTGREGDARLARTRRPERHQGGRIRGQGLERRAGARLQGRHRIVQHRDELLLADVHALVRGQHVFAAVGFGSAGAGAEELDGPQLHTVDIVAGGVARAHERVGQVVLDELAGDVRDAGALAQAFVQGGGWCVHDVSPGVGAGWLDGCGGMARSRLIHDAYSMAPGLCSSGAERCGAPGCVPGSAAVRGVRGGWVVCCCMVRSSWEHRPELVCAPAA